MNWVLLTAEESTEALNTIPGEPWMYGAAGLGILMGLLYIVTRFNSER